MKKLLLVDDDPVDLALILRALNSWSDQIKIETCTSGRDALRRYDESLHDTPFDIVVTDYHMPGLTGLDVVACVAERPVDQPPAMFLLTSMRDAALRQEACARGARSVLIKPTSLADYAKIAEEILA